MATYASYTDVAAELGGVSITASSTPSSSTVDGWIQDAEKEIDLMSGQTYSSTQVSSTVWEYHNYDGSGVIRLDNYPVVSVDLLQAEQNGLGGATESWQALAGPGKTTNEAFELVPDIGAIRFHANSLTYGPKAGHRTIRVAYTYGHTSVPRNVKELATKIAARRYVQSVATNTASTGGGAISVGAISISDPNNYVLNHLGRLDLDIERLSKQLVGKFRTINYDVGLY